MKKLLQRVNQFSKSKNQLLQKEHRTLQGPIEVLSDIDGFKSAERFFVLDEKIKDWIELDFSNLPKTEMPNSGDIIKVEGFYRGGSFFNHDWDRLLVLHFEVVQKSLGNKSSTP